MKIFNLFLYAILCPASMFGMESSFLNTFKKYDILFNYETIDGRNHIVFVQTKRITESKTEDYQLAHKKYIFLYNFLGPAKQRKPREIVIQQTLPQLNQIQKSFDKRNYLIAESRVNAKLWDATSLFEPKFLHKVIQSDNSYFLNLMIDHLIESNNIDSKIYYKYGNDDDDDEPTYTPLHLAIKFKNKKACWQLFCKGARPNSLIIQKLFLILMNDIKDAWHSKNFQNFTWLLFATTDILKTTSDNHSLLSYAYKNQKWYLGNCIENFLMQNVLDKSYYIQNNIGLIIKKYNHFHPENTISKETFDYLLKQSFEKKYP